ncbi:hypothetical protein AVEN_48622-1 [Araneus ventricosus]|uniref:Uncharacterized protein n=1 Tax=Araneus ventricosus TaxID=182803 RepID=A0A4Y2IYX7_ARAVE|nr:hypothetical protein AVEN_48622-1 [Araneus ventricosus]
MNCGQGSSRRQSFHLTVTDDTYFASPDLPEGTEISTKSSYPLSSRRRGACFTNLAQDKRGVRRRYEAGRVNIKDLPRPGQAHVVTKSATISAVDELLRLNHRITACEIAVELSISKGTVHHIIHKKLGYGEICAQWVAKLLSANEKTERMGVCLTQQFLH